MEFIKKIIESPEFRPNSWVLELLTNYVLFLKPRKDHSIISDNRRKTIRKRETSTEGLKEKFETGEDAIYNLIRNDKNMILSPKVKITPKDIAEHIELKQLVDTIKAWDAEMKEKNLTGKNLYKAKKALIEMRQMQYIIKEELNKPSRIRNFRKTNIEMQFSVDTWYMEKNGNVKLVSENTIDFKNGKHIEMLLHFYPKLIDSAWDFNKSEMKHVLWDLELLINAALKEIPHWKDIVIWKIDKRTNKDIRKMLQEDHNLVYSEEYISTLYRNKIPNYLASYYENDVNEWYHLNKVKGVYKKCNRCGEHKLMNNTNFSLNKDSKDGFYSICKSCRRKKKK